MKNKYFVYDADNGAEFFDTEEEAVSEANKCIQWYAKNAHEGWDEYVDQVCWGEVKQRGKEFKTGNIVEFEGEMVECVDYKLEDLQ